MNSFVSFEGKTSTFLHNIYGTTKGEIRTTLLEQDLTFARSFFKEEQQLNILDLGSGIGFFSSKFASLKHKADLCDISPEMIEKAKLYAKEQNTFENQRFFCANCFELPQDILSSSYDLILCHAVMEWVEDQERLLKLLYSLLKPQGLLSLLVYNKDALLYQSLIVGNFSYIECDFKSKHKQKLTPKYPLSPSVIEANLKALNLTIKRKTGIRVFHDYMRDKWMQKECFEEVLKYENLFCRDPRFVNLGRYIHYLCQKE